MEENKEIIDKKNTIKQKINIDQQNNANINDTISFMSYHIDGDKTKEYLDFMKKVRKLRKKINKKKEKLYEYDKIEKAYLEKDSRIRNIFKNFAAKYKDRYNNYETVTAKEKNQREKFSLYQINNLEYLAQKIDRANLYYGYVETYNIDFEYAFSRQKNNDLASTLDIRFMLQNHYNHINARIMADILDYYECELEYWKSCLKQIEIENIKEFE